MSKITSVFAPPFKLYVTIPFGVPFNVKAALLPEQIVGPLLLIMLAVVTPVQVLAETLNCPVPLEPKNNALLLVALEAVLPQVPLYPPNVVFTVNVLAFKLFEPRLAETPVRILRLLVTLVALVNVFIPVPSNDKLLTTFGKPLPVF